MSKKIIIANWKMNTTYREAMDLIDFYKIHLRKNNNLKLIVCPPSIWLESIYNKLQNSHIEIGAQNIHYLDFGSITGEVSAPMVKKFAKYVIVGHSERKRFFHESNELVYLKVRAILKSNMIPIICFGEELKEEGIDHILSQVAKSVQGISDKEVKKIIFAYEPVWAIGTGKVATAEHARDMVESARERLAVVYNRTTAYKIKFLYGGSVNSKNVNKFMCPELDGVLVGTSALKIKEFSKICEVVSEEKRA